MFQVARVHAIDRQQRVMLLACVLDLVSDLVGVGWGYMRSPAVRILTSARADGRSQPWRGHYLNRGGRRRIHLQKPPGAMLWRTIDFQHGRRLVIVKIVLDRTQSAVPPGAPRSAVVRVLLGVVYRASRWRGGCGYRGRRSALRRSKTNMQDLMAKKTSGENGCVELWLRSIARVVHSNARVLAPGVQEW